MLVGLLLGSLIGASLSMLVVVMVVEVRHGKRWVAYHTQIKALGARVEACEKELDIQAHDEPSEFGRGRRRRLWLEELEKQPLDPEERRAWEAGM